MPASTAPAGALTGYNFGRPEVDTVVYYKSLTGEEPPALEDLCSLTRASLFILPYRWANKHADSLQRSITTCQNMGTKVLVERSIEGNMAENSAKQVAQMAWSEYGYTSKSQSEERPLGSVILDGFHMGLSPLDVPVAYYHTLRELTKTDPARTYLMTQTVTCDGALSDEMLREVDMVFVNDMTPSLLGSKAWHECLQKFSARLPKDKWFYVGMSRLGSEKVADAMRDIKSLALPNFAGASFTWANGDETIKDLQGRVTGVRSVMAAE
ncbi:hypothetical protein Purlil1_11831 [Purpureocillium lilacinum]|uniref:Uncharacterized protein n=1 Tax=Purpureocillium lilacinum TaxID=33203 RepID=A0ABR0BIQ0_PURLI|nr:hypothetical protein Purlil1_11831 [Purpureocillium lilacinum]